MNTMYDNLNNELRLAKSDLKTEVSQVIKQAIISENFKQGERLVESEIASKMGISRGPIREAIRELVKEGLLVNIPRKGTYIISISQEEVKEIYAIRMALESLAVEQAVKNLTEKDWEDLKNLIDLMMKAASQNDLKTLLDYDFEFHKLIYLHSNNRYLIKFLSEISIVFRLALNEGAKRIKDINALAMTHQTLLDTFISRSPEKAVQVMRDHIVKIWL